MLPLIKPGRRVIARIDVTERHSREVFRGVLRYTRLHHPWQLIPVAPGDARQHQPDFFNRADGLIAQLGGTTIQNLIAPHAQRIRIVNVSGVFDDLAYAQVVPDNHAIGRLAAEHLLGTGAACLGYVGFKSPRAFVRARQEGFSAHADEAGRDVIHFKIDNDEGALSRWLTALPKPAAVLGCNDSCARRIVHCAGALGLRVPDDLAVMGVDNDDLTCEMAPVPLTSIETNAMVIGYRAAELLDAMLHGRPAPTAPLLITPGVVVPRDSTLVNHRVDPDLRAALAYMSGNYRSPITISQLADAVAVSRRLLERKFRSVLGRSPLEELRRVRIARARQLLTTTDWNLERVADECGFSSAKSFGIVFQREMQISPSRYRRRTRVPGTDPLHV